MRHLWRKHIGGITAVAKLILWELLFLLLLAIMLVTDRSRLFLQHVDALAPMCQWWSLQCLPWKKVQLRFGLRTSNRCRCRISLCSQDGPWLLLLGCGWSSMAVGCART